MIHYNIIVKGKVQGVSYRAWTKRKAIEIGVTGWVQNKPDGSVYIETEGSEGQIKDFMEWIGEGPEHADVQEVYFESAPLKGFQGFEIKH